MCRAQRRVFNGLGGVALSKIATTVATSLAHAEAEQQTSFYGP